MATKKPVTPRSQAKRMLAQLFLRSRERALAMKLAGYCCGRCGKKQSKAKGREVSIEVHHLAGVKVWEEILNLIYSELLVSPEKLMPLCRGCHDEIHGRTTAEME